MPSSSDTKDAIIPTYRIDLGLPPAERYAEICKDFTSQMQTITTLFGQLLAEVIPFKPLCKLIEWAAPFLLRSVYNKEENAELKGMAKATSIPIHFFVALNVILDILLGCTSGGALVIPSEKNGKPGKKRMMHFRALDWQMPVLRNVLVALEFVDSKSAEPEKVIATSITYVGYVGVLTGVKQNLSLSMNFREHHRCSTISLRIHQFLVLLGFRPGISSILREALLNPAYQDLEWVTQKLTNTRTAPFYLVLCTPTQTTVVEKDLHGEPESRIRSSEDFIAQTNHDNPIDDTPIQHSMIPGMDNTVERLDCIKGKWDDLKKAETKLVENGPGEGGDGRFAVKEEMLAEWMRASLTMNELTHFGCIMDPLTAKVRWLAKGDQ